MESEPMLTPGGKSHVQEAQSRIEATTLHHTGQRAHTLPTELFRLQDLCSTSAFLVELCPDRVIAITYKLALRWLPCQALGAIGLALALVGSVSVYCDWVRFYLRLLSQYGSVYNCLSRSVVGTLSNQPTTTTLLLLACSWFQATPTWSSFVCVYI